MEHLDFCLFFLGNGRKGYLERAVESWEANLKSAPKYKFIFDDSGDSSYVSWLAKRFPEYQVIPIAKCRSMGQRYAVNSIFKKLKKIDVNYILQVEEDWILNRPLNGFEVISVMLENENILQMRIPRNIWYAKYDTLDINAGSNLQAILNKENSKSYIKKNNNRSWYEWRGKFVFWSHNPSFFNKSVCEEKYWIQDPYESNERDAHEMDFGTRMFEKYPKKTIGFWAENPYDSYVTHIGIHDESLLKQLPEHPLAKI